MNLEIKVYFTLVVLLCSFSHLKAQDYPKIYDPSKDNSFSSMPPHTAQIGNFVAEEIWFGLSFDRKSWKNYNLQKNTAKLFDLRTPINNQNRQAYVRLCTGTATSNECKIYEITVFRRYRIYADGPRWGLTVMTENDR